MKHVCLITIFFLCIIITGWSSANAEAASSSTRGIYLADRGIIIPPEEVHIDAYIAGIDYNYSIPESSDFEVTLHTGNRQLYRKGQNEILQIGIQAGKTDFADITPMNLAFVIDRSGSMASADKLNWVKDAFDIFINKVRPEDYVSLIVYNSGAQVIFPSTKMDSEINRAQFRRVVHSISAAGSTNIRDGLSKGCLEVLKNFNSEYVNRVMLLSDGQDTCGNSHADIIQVAENFCSNGITISTIGVGTSFDLELMVELAKRGEGSSRFISDREEMQKIFGSELDRMIVANVRNMKMNLKFLLDVTIIDTWGYNNVRNGSEIFYSLPSLHNGDYETILVNFETKNQEYLGTVDMASFTIDYEDNFGNKQTSGPHIIQVELVEDPSPVTGFSDGMVLNSGSMLHFAQNVKKIGDLYYSKNTPTYLEDAINITLQTKKELLNAETRLETDAFTDQINILNQYVRILGNGLKYSEENIVDLSNDIELLSSTPDRSFDNHLKNLCKEIILDLNSKRNSKIAVCRFASQGSASQQFLNTISNNLFTTVSAVKTHTIIKPERLALLLQKEQLSYSDLTDKVKAIQIGQLLDSDYIITGNVIETNNTYIIFTRLLNVHTHEVESSAQVILSR
jgi:TolB-like protein